MAYSTWENVKAYLPDAVTVEGDNPNPDPDDPAPESLTQADIARWIGEADQYIDGRLGSVYSVPLKKANIGGRISYPPPIPSISARLAAKLIWEERLSGADRQTGEFNMNHYTQAMEELAAVLRGGSRLRGQDGHMSSRFANSGWYPIPPHASKEPPPQQTK